MFIDGRELRFGGVVAFPEEDYVMIGLCIALPVQTALAAWPMISLGEEQTMKYGEAFGSLSVPRDHLDAPVLRSLVATGRFSWVRSVLHPLRAAMRRLLQLLFERERLPRGWERGL